MSEELYYFSPENLLAQAQNVPLELGYHRVRFYVDEQGIPSKEKTSSTEEFFLSPSGGTLRDREMNIVIYSAKYDKYKGYGKA
ncbi:MAG: hypothetical protein IPM69_19455 [Ignavibacteria bacterium]|nr:hypothetical protein [Ignavibacteria bacterium]